MHSLRELARLGASLRMREIAEERSGILEEFPDLRPAAPAPRPKPVETATRTRRRMSTASRKVASARMKKYWVKRRKAQGAKKK